MKKGLLIALIAGLVLWAVSKGKASSQGDTISLSEITKARMQAGEMGSLGIYVDPTGFSNDQIAYGRLIGVFP